MEASTATQKGPGGRRARGGPRLLRLQNDEQLVELLRAGDERAFEAIVHRYRSRLFGFCRKMLGSPQDAEDVLQEVLANAYRAILADSREINLRPWLFRIARNRCLNHLQRIRAVPTEQERLDRIAGMDAAATHGRVQKREEFRLLLGDLEELPPSQRQALLLREVHGLSYDQVGEQMTTTVPAVRSLLTRARTSLAEASQARDLTCGEIQRHLAEAAEDDRRVAGPARRHIRDCQRCSDFGAEIGAGAAALSPLGLLLAFKDFLLSKLGGGAAGAATGVGGGAAAAGGGGLIGGAAGWATGSKVAAATVAVVVVGVGANELATSGDPGPGARIAPAVSGGERAPGSPAGDPVPGDPAGSIPTLPNPAVEAQSEAADGSQPAPPAAPIIQPEEIPPLDGPQAADPTITLPAPPPTPEDEAGCDPQADPAAADACPPR